MATTRHYKIEVKNRNAVVSCKKQHADTTGWVVKRTDAIKVVSDRKNPSVFVGVRKVNYAAKKRQEFYEKINEMLGGY